MSQTVPAITFPNDHSTDDWIPVVLAGLQHLGAHREAVRMADLCDWFAALPTFPADGWESWGMMPTKGYPLGKRAVTLAAAKLREEGLMESPKRGYYLLTDKAPNTNPEPVETPVPTNVEPGVATDTPVNIEIETTEGVVWTPPSVDPNEGAAPYVADVGLRKMAITGSRCFGAWSDRSASCTDCPLAHLCAEASTVDLAEVAADLDRQTEQEIEDAKRRASQPAPSAHTKASYEGTVVPAPFDVLCSSCGVPIKFGEDATHIAAGTGKPGGIYHPVCASLL